MGRSVVEAAVTTRNARSKLAVGKNTHWRAIDRGLHLGYRKGRDGGTWIGRRRRREGGYEERRLGQADDMLDADDRAVFTYSQALKRTRAWHASCSLKESGEAEEAEPSLTIAQVMHSYLQWYALHRKGLATTRNAIETHVLPALGKIEVCKLTTARVRRWHQALADSPARVRPATGAAPAFRAASGDPNAVRARKATANRVLTILKAALNRAYNEGLLPSAELWQRVRPFAGVEIARLDYRSEAECGRILNACAPDFRRLVRGALVSGARYGELTRLEVRDFNPDARALLVQEAKSGKPRHIPLDSEAASFFGSITAGRAPQERLFLRADGKPWGKSHQARPLEGACAKARVPRTSFHILRHTWASQRIMKGMPLMVVAKVLGHRDTRMVEKHYGHLARGYVHEMVDRTALDFGPHDECVVKLPSRVKM